MTVPSGFGVGKSEIYMHPRFALIERAMSAILDRIANSHKDPEPIQNLAEALKALVAADDELRCHISDDGDEDMFDEGEGGVE